MKRKITKVQALADWRENILPRVKAHYETDGIPDWPARSESWTIYVDELNKDGIVTDWQAYNWMSPKECGK